MVMTDAAEAVVKDAIVCRILRVDDYHRWLHAAMDETRALCVPYGAEVAIDQSAQPWRSGWFGSTPATTCASVSCPQIASTLAAHFPDSVTVTVL
jgi:hypothetical protein